MRHSSSDLLRQQLEALEVHLEITAAVGRPSPWIERLRERVRELRERIEVRAHC